MLERLRRFLILALLLIVPLQGAAAVVHALDCTPHPDAAAAAPAHDHGDHHAAHHHHPDESTGSASDHASHQCCHHFPAAPLPIGTSSSAEHGVMHVPVLPLELSFVLERPQRPPRS